MQELAGAMRLRAGRGSRANAVSSCSANDNGSEMSRKATFVGTRQGRYSALEPQGRCGGLLFLTAGCVGVGVGVGPEVGSWGNVPAVDALSAGHKLHWMDKDMRGSGAV